MNGLRLLLGTCAGGGVVVCCCGGGGEEKDYSIVYLYTCIIGYLYDNSKIKNEKEERGQRQKKKII